MKYSPDKLLPSITGSVANKVLFLEVHFLLRAGKSPVYFGLTDFIENYSIEILYIAVTFYLFTGWIAPIVILGHYAVVGSLALCAKQFLRIFKFSGIPVFAALNQHNSENSVSILIAKDYAKSNNHADLERRIERYEKDSNENLNNEAVATANFFLIISIALISYLTNAPNFLIKISSFADPIFSGYAYHVFGILLIVQGIIGRISSFHLINTSANLPPNFFASEAERANIASWNNDILKRYQPLAEKWKSKLK